jgi:signal transduction histidine kinase
MLENLLFWARNQTDGIKVKAVKFDVVQMIEDVIQVLENQARDKNISFIVPDIKKYVFADSEMIKVVIRNLISNAIKFTKNGGDILVTVTDYSENELLIGVKDSGVGISEEKQRNLFTLGSGSSMGTDKEKGTGLGLVLCKELVEKHGGKIWVNSKINEGSIFSFTIPNE